MHMTLFSPKTPAHHAALNGHLPCIKLLVERGADLDIPNGDGKTPVELAVHEAHANCAQYLQHETGNQHNCDLVTLLNTTNMYNSDPQMSFPHFFTYLSLRTCIDKAFFFKIQK